MPCCSFLYVSFSFLFLFFSFLFFLSFFLSFLSFLSFLPSFLSFELFTSGGLHLWVSSNLEKFDRYFFKFFKKNSPFFFLPPGSIIVHILECLKLFHSITLFIYSFFFSAFHFRYFDCFVHFIKDFYVRATPIPVTFLGQKWKYTF